MLFDKLRTLGSFNEMQQCSLQKNASAFCNATLKKHCGKSALVQCTAFVNWGDSKG